MNSENWKWLISWCKNKTSNFHTKKYYLNYYRVFLHQEMNQVADKIFWILFLLKSSQKFLRFWWREFSSNIGPFQMVRPSGRWKKNYFWFLLSFSQAFSPAISINRVFNMMRFSIKIWTTWLNQNFWSGGRWQTFTF